MAQDNPQSSEATQEPVDIFPPDFFEWQSERHDDELDDVIELLRAESLRAFRWGREGDMQLLDGIIERLQRHEHRR